MSGRLTPEEQCGALLCNARCCGRGAGHQHQCESEQSLDRKRERDAERKRERYATDPIYRINQNFSSMQSKRRQRIAAKGAQIQAWIEEA